MPAEALFYFLQSRFIMWRQYTWLSIASFLVYNDGFINREISLRKKKCEHVFNQQSANATPITYSTFSDLNLLQSRLQSLSPTRFSECDQLFHRFLLHQKRLYHIHPQPSCLLLWKADGPKIFWRGNRHNFWVEDWSGVLSFYLVSPNVFINFETVKICQDFLLKSKNSPHLRWYNFYEHFWVEGCSGFLFPPPFRNDQEMAKMICQFRKYITFWGWPQHRLRVGGRSVPPLPQNVLDVAKNVFLDTKMHSIWGDVTFLYLH